MRIQIGSETTLKLKVASGSLGFGFATAVDSVADPNQDPHVFGPPGSGSTSQRYGSGSFYHNAKIVRKTLIATIL